MVREGSGSGGRTPSGAGLTVSENAQVEMVAEIIRDRVKIDLVFGLEGVVEAAQEIVERMRR